jgi:PAS domain S-box-containing protein
MNKRLQMHRVLLVEDSAVVRERLRSQIEEDGRCSVVGEAADLAQARLMFHESGPDAVLLDLQLANDTSFELLVEFKRSRPECKIVVLTQFSVHAYRERCLELGADRFLAKTSDFERVVPLLVELLDDAAPAETSVAQYAMPSLEAIVEGLPVAVYACDSEGRVVLFNAAAVELWGREADREPDRWCGAWRVMGPDGQALPRDAHPLRRLAVEPHALASQELVFERPDGTRRTVQCLPQLHADATGKVCAVVGVLTDVTAARQADQTRRESDLLLKRVLDASRSALWDLDLGSGRVHLSENWSEMMGGARVPISTEFDNLAARVPAADRQRIGAAMLPALKGEADHYAVEHAVRTDAGALMWVLSEGRVVERDAHGRALRAVGTNRDITAQVGAQRALRQSEAQLRRLIDHLAAGVLVYDRDGAIVLSNAHAQQLLHLPLRRTQERSAPGLVIEFVHEDGHTLDAADRPVDRVLARGTPVLNQVLGLRRAGDDGMQWAIVNAFPEFGEDQCVAQVVLSFVDISDRRLAEQALRRSEGRLRALVELSSDWLWEQDESLRFTLVSDSGDDLAGLSAAEHLGKARWDLPHVDIGDALWAEHRAQLARREVFRDFEITRRDKHGALRTVSVSGMPVFDDNGRFAGYRGISRDVTSQRAADSALRALEMQLLESQRMESIGTLAGGIAHDFNALVTAFQANAAIACEALAGDARHGAPAALASLARIKTAGRRARALIQQILAFARRQPQVLVNQALKPAVEETIALFRSCLPPSVSLHCELAAAGPAHVMADSTQIQQVLMNLCTNALHALDNRNGHIVVGLDEVRLDEVAASPLALSPGHHARLWVRDNGRGMDPKLRARIFEPLFTTKPAGHGTGLGLSVVKRIMAFHQGAVDVQSQPGLGSTFEIYLPIVDPDSAMMPLEIDTTPVPLQAEGHVLVVDDDEVIQLTAVGLLEREGLRVTSCASANEALAAVRAEPHKFNLVVTDFNMPAMSGLDMARNLALIRGDLPVLIISGLVTTELRAQARDAEVSSVLDKEKLGSELAHAVRRALRPASAPAFSADPRNDR